MSSIAFSSSSLIHTSTSSNLLLNPSSIFFSLIITSIWYFLKFSLYWSSHCVCLFFSSVQQAFLWPLLWNLHQIDCLSPFCLVLSQLAFLFFFLVQRQNLWKRTKWSADVLLCTLLFWQGHGCCVVCWWAGLAPGMAVGPSPGSCWALVGGIIAPPALRPSWGAGVGKAVGGVCLLVLTG